MIDKEHLIKRFVSYITVDTESDPNSTTTPSTAKQWDLANALVEELKEIGIYEFVRSGRVAIIKPMERLNKYLQSLEAQGHF